MDSGGAKEPFVNELAENIEVTTQASIRAFVRGALNRPIMVPPYKVYKRRRQNRGRSGNAA
jgi:hypothetical protein